MSATLRPPPRSPGVLVGDDQVVALGVDPHGGPVAHGAGEQGPADVYTATLRVVSRQTEYDANVTRPVLEACVAACRSCGDE
jgi:hypothetical protein